MALSSICGWLGRDSVERGQAEAAARQMLEQPRNGAADALHVHTETALALGGSGSANLCTADASGVLAAISGRAFWSDPELQRVAAEHGLAASLIPGYQRWGRGLLKHLHGAFSLAVIEPDRDMVLVAIDRIGIATLCYAIPRQGFVFASRADAVARHPWVRGEITPQGVFNYLFFHVVPAPETIFRGVRKLLPAQYALYRKGEVETGFYWQLDYCDRAAVPVPELARQFRALLPEVVTRACGEGEVATFLSGGTDSSTVTGILAQLRNSPIASYSIGFNVDGFDEMDYARIAAERFEVQHRTYYVTPEDVFHTIPLIANAYDEPFGNASAVPTYLCANRAREDGVDVMLAGDGGDEIFGGNARYARQKVFEAYRLIPASVRKRLLEPLLGFRAFERIPRAAKVMNYVRQARVPLPDRLESYNFLNREGLAEIFEPEFLAAISPEQPFALMREVYERTASESAVNRMMHLDLKLTLADNDLRKVTRMCAVAGIDVRYPFLDEEMVEFSGRVPASEKVKRLRLRHFFKESLKEFLPHETITKAKHGFGLPFGVWLSGNKLLYELAGDSILKFGRRGWLRPAYLEGLVDHRMREHASYYGVMVWVILMLEQWLQAQEIGAS